MHFIYLKLYSIKPSRIRNFTVQISFSCDCCGGCNIVQHNRHRDKLHGSQSSRRHNMESKISNTFTRGLLSRVLTGGVAKLGRGISRLCCVVRSKHTGEYFAERSRRCSLRSPRRLHRVAGGVRVAGAGHLPRHEGRPPQLPWPLPLRPAGRQPRVEQRPRQEGGAVGPPAGQVGG